MRVMLWTYNEAVNCENNYTRTFTDYEDLLLHLVEIGDEGYTTNKIRFV